ncbi:hypothetical protein QTP81_10100 [Alteromonas sp. ASW11-36]|uniref:TonB C-terminal domain-containing protein n=1 Tax=Alteromonas arenosi TaxID=3055817 RepID=A0ABT7SXN7_9ALTE|nr:hypothetical protein [Alteromonas sp. ASW11-36]MDM7860948.1 hypothetical protein [Alteromonas sp. ASW11-36]
MSKYSMLAMFLFVALVGCQATAEPQFNAETINVEFESLDDYWVEIPEPIKYHKGRPKFIPDGRGSGVYAITIDSNGLVVKKELVSSIPEGWLTQKHVDHMPTKQYQASKNNVERQPVRVEISFSVMPRSEIGTTSD